MVKAGSLRVAAAVRRGSEGPSEGIRRIRRGLPEEEPSATAVCIDEGRGTSAALLSFFTCALAYDTRGIWYNIRQP